jgi:carbamoylphosphate synthase small subunit
MYEYQHDLYYIGTFALFEGVDTREITNQCRQYGATVHLFIVTGHSPEKSTFMSPIFTYDHNTCY